MTLKKKYRNFKRLLQLTLLINGFFIAAGVAGLYRYVQVRDIYALHVAIAGCGTFIFGVLLPWQIFRRLTQLNKSIRLQTEQAVTKMVGGILESYRDSEGDVLGNPVFWINCVLTVTEVFVENSENQAAVTLAEIIPMLRQEVTQKLKKPKPKSKTKS
jgi:hypothetical protein